MLRPSQFAGRRGLLAFSHSLLFQGNAKTEPSVISRRPDY